MSEELMRLRHENQVLRAENEALSEVAEIMDFLDDAGIDNCEAYDIGMRKFHESKMEPVVEVVDEKVKKHYLTTGQDALKPSKGKRAPKDKSDE